MTTKANNSSLSLFQKLKSRPRYQRWSLYLAFSYGLYALLVGILIPSMLTQVFPDKFQQFTGRAANIEKISINPFLLRLTLTQLTIEETKEQLAHPDAESSFAGFGTFVVELRFWHSLFNQAISLENVSLRQPYGFIALERSPLDNTQAHPFTYTQLTYNFSDILNRLSAQAAKDETSAPQKESQSAPKILINHLTLAQGDFRFFDTLTQAHIQYPKFDIRLSNFDSQALLNAMDESEPSNSFSFHGTGADGNEIHTQGQVQLSPFELNADLQVGRLQLATFWPLVKEHIQAKLISGNLTLASQFNLTQATEGMDFSIKNQLFTLEELQFDYANQPILSLPLLAVEDLLAKSNDNSIYIKRIHSQDLVTSLSLDNNGLNLTNLFTPDFLQTPRPKENQAQSPLTVVSTELDIPSEPTSASSEVAASTEQLTASAPTSAAWKLTIDDTKLENYRLDIQEKLATNEFNHWKVDAINLQLGQFISDLTKPLNYALNLDINSSGHFATRGSLDLRNQALNAGFTLENFELNQLQGYITPHVNVLLEQGRLHSQGTLSTNAQTEIELSSELLVENLDIKDKQLGEPLISWDKLKVNTLDYTSKDHQLTIDTIGITQAFAKIIITEDSSTNIGDLAVKTPASSSTKAANASSVDSKLISAGEKPAIVAKPLTLTIGKILFDNGSAFFADKSLTPNFAASIEQLHGGISQLSSLGDSKASVDISGKIDRYAPVTLKGQVNPLLAQPYLDLALDFNHVELTSVNPYSGTYAGYYIDKGQLSLALNYQLEENQLKGNNHLVIDQLELGKPSNSDLATSLPITLAIALLQDSNGVIDLGMEVSGDVNSPDFSVGSIVMTAITNVITKAVTSPFSLLASLIGTDEELDKLVYSPGSSTLAEPQQQKLTQLAKALAERPKLALSVEGSLDIAKDTHALKANQIAIQLNLLAPNVATEAIEKMGASTIAAHPELSEAIVELYTNKLDLDPEQIKANILAKHDSENENAPALTAQALDIEWKMALYNLSLNAETVEVDALGLLAQRRAQEVKAFMVDKLSTPPKSIFIIDSRINAKQTGSLALLSLDAG